MNVLFTIGGIAMKFNTDHQFTHRMHYDILTYHLVPPLGQANMSTL